MISSRLLTAIQALIRQTLPQVPYQSPYRYRVVSQGSDGRVNLQAVRKSGDSPDMRAIAVLHGVPGTSSRLTLGSLVLVEFIEGDAAQPIVTHFEAEGGAGWLPISLTFDASSEVAMGASSSAVKLADASGYAVRYGDNVTVGTATGPITFVSAGAPAVGPPATGQSKVKV